MYYKIAQLIQTPGVKGNTIGDVFIAQPDGDKENLAGKLFVLVEIESKSVDNLKIINFLIESLVNNYYQNDKLILRERIKTIRVEYVFESALAKTNKEFVAFLDSEKIKFYPNLINITAGIIFENELYFSSLGKNKALLIFKEKKQTTKASTGRRRPELKKIFNEKETFKIVDIINRTKGQERVLPAPVTAELFSNVISGHLPREGMLVFSNEALPEYLSNNQLIKIVSTLPPAGAVEQIKNILSSVNSYVSFFAILIKNTLGEREEVKRQTLPSSAHGSVTNFNVMEERTEKFLAPRGYLNFKKIANYLLKIMPSKRRGLRMGAVSATSGSLIKDKIIFKKKPRFLSVLKILNYPKNIFYGLVNFWQHLRKFSTKARLLAFLGDIKNKIRANFVNFIFFFKNLNKKSKTLILIALVCFSLLALNMILVNIKNKKTAEQNSFNEAMRIIEQKENQLEASLLYKDEEGAKRLAKEIEKLLSELPQKSKTQILEKNNLWGRYNLLVEKIKHIVKLTNLKELANFSNLENGASPTEVVLVPEKDKIYSPDENKKVIYSLDIGKNAVTIINNSSVGEQIVNLKYPVPDKNNNVYFLNGDKILSLDAEEKLKNLPLNPPLAPQNISTLSFYNNMLYLVDRQNNQIYKFKKEKSSFGSRIAWLKEKIDLNNIISMDIDGSIYLLASNGELNKFLKGKKENFTLDSVIPSLSQTSKVIVSKELNYIYIFEPTAKRLVVFDKNGKFLLQYQVEELNNLKDFAINEKKKTIYLLDGSSIYTGELTHLK